MALDNCGAKGTPAVCWNSAVFPVCRNVGYQLGYLTWLFSRFFSIYLEPEKILAAYADDGEHEVLAIVSENTVNNVREFS